MKIILGLYLLISQANLAYAGEIKPAGTKLSEESYVFSIEEAESLKARIIELEKKEKKLEQYLLLDELNNKKIDIYLSNEEIYKRRIDNMDSIIVDLENVNNRYSKINRQNGLENTILVTSSVAATILSFIAIDYLNDNYIRD